MTITERNQKLYDLRKKLDQKRMELAWIETEIMAVNSEYDRQNVDLYEQMFGEKNTLWDHLDRVTPNNWCKQRLQLIPFKSQNRKGLHLF